MKPDNAGAEATITCNCLGSSPLPICGENGEVAQDKMQAVGVTSYLTTKLVTGRFFMERMLPETSVHLARIQSGKRDIMELAAETF